MDDKFRNIIKKLSWYHTIKLPNNLLTNGVYDHRPILKYYDFPSSLKNKTVLDVGAADGFFSFEFEKKGAKEVMAIDTHQFDGSIGHTDVSPTKIENYLKKYRCFNNEKSLYLDIYKSLKIKTSIRLLIIKKILKSQVKFKIESIYNLKKKKKKFDLVFCGDLIEHLKNPLIALENLVSVSKNLCIISLSNCLEDNLILKLFPGKNKTLLEYHGNKAGGSFFHIYPLTFKEMCLASGFKKVKIISQFNLLNKKYNRSIPHAVFHCFV